MAQEKPRKGVIRLSLDFHPDVRALMNDLETRTRAASVTEVIRRSINLYDVIFQHHEKGGEVVLISKEGKTETIKFI